MGFNRPMRVCRKNMSPFLVYKEPYIRGKGHVETSTCACGKFLITQRNRGCHFKTEELGCSNSQAAPKTSAMASNKAVLPAGLDAALVSSNI